MLMLGDPIFCIVDVKRTYVVEKETGGYSYNITLKNIGDYASVVEISSYFDFIENGTKSAGTSFQYSWNTGEIISVGMGFGFSNQAALPINKWIKLEIVSQSTFQSFLIHFDTILYVSVSSHKLWYPKDITINGRLINTTSNMGIQNQNLSVYINGIPQADIKTDIQGNFSYTWSPTYGHYDILIVWSHEIKIAKKTYVIHIETNDTLIWTRVNNVQVDELSLDYNSTAFWLKLYRAIKNEMYWEFDKPMVCFLI